MTRLAIIVTLLILTSLVAAVHAGDEESEATVTARQAAHLAGLNPCCVEAARAGKGCCGQDAAAVQAGYAEFEANERALAGMSPCCAAKVTVGQGCCGMDADGLKATFASQVRTARAELAVLAAMHPCCADAVEAGEGCCGKSAQELKAGYKDAVKEARKKT